MSTPVFIPRYWISSRVWTAGMGEAEEWSAVSRQRAVWGAEPETGQARTSFVHRLAAGERLPKKKQCRE